MALNLILVWEGKVRPLDVYDRQLLHSVPTMFLITIYVCVVFD
jgi:hypothetical protein